MLSGILRVHVDSTVPWEEIGYRKPVAFIRHRAAEARHAAGEAVEEMARLGDRLRDIHEGVRIGALVGAAAWPPLKEVNVGIVPRSRVEIEFKPVRPGTLFEALA